MSSPTAFPAFLDRTLLGRSEQEAGLEVVENEWRASLRAMASTVSLVLGPDTVDPDGCFARVGAVFAEVEAQCTRFDAMSDLMCANAAGAHLFEVGEYCYEALVEAARAHRVTGGLFDPRVLRALHRLGYVQSRERRPDGGECAPSGLPDWSDAGGTAARPAWDPRFDERRHAVQVGPEPIDLGGIAKGLAVRWAAQRIDDCTPSYLLDAGGDCYVRGNAPDGDAWRIGIENPRGGERPVAVAAITDSACVTSSTRLRRWDRGGRSVHHLIDPRTGEPGGAGLLAVTVVDSDPAFAEVWSKVFFLHGADAIAAAVDDRGAAALWVREDGSLGLSAAMRPLVIWEDVA